MPKPSNAHELDAFLVDIYESIDADIKNAEFPLDDGGQLSYCLYIRAHEIFISIVALLRIEIPSTATMLLRPLCETYALLRESIRDKSFASKYLKAALKEKVSWADKANAINYANLGIDEAEVSRIRQSAENEMSEIENNLRSIKSLLAESDSVLYFHIYSHSSLYIHSNAQSMAMYFASDNSLIPNEKRDDSGKYQHITLAASTVFIKMYDLICERLGREMRLTYSLNTKMEVLALNLREAEKA